MRAADGQRVERLIGNDDGDGDEYRQFVRQQQKILKQYERAKTTKEVPGLQNPLLNGDIEEGKEVVDAGRDY